MRRMETLMGTATVAILGAGVEGTSFIRRYCRDAGGQRRELEPIWIPARPSAMDSEIERATVAARAAGIESFFILAGRQRLRVVTSQMVMG